MSRGLSPVGRAARMPGGPFPFSFSSYAYWGSFGSRLPPLPEGGAAAEGSTAIPLLLAAGCCCCLPASALCHSRSSWASTAARLAACAWAQVWGCLCGCGRARLRLPRCPCSRAPAPASAPAPAAAPAPAGALWPAAIACISSRLCSRTWRWVAATCRGMGPGGPPVSLAGGYQQRAPPLRCRCNSMPPPGPAQPVSLQCHLGPCQCCCILGQPPGAARSAALGAARASPCLHSSAALKPQRRRRPFCRLYIFAGPSCFLSPAACRRRRC